MPLVSRRYLEEQERLRRADVGRIEALEATNGQINGQLQGMYDLVQKLTDQPQAYRWDNMWTWATPHSTKRRPMAVASLELLRNFADRYDVLRSCINHLKREAAAVPFEVIPKDVNDHSAETRNRCAEAAAFFGRHGGLGGFGKRPRHFQNEIFEDALVIGNYAVYIEFTRGGTPYTTLAIDAATIRPKVNSYGWQDSDNAFEQQVMGVPVRTFSAKELLWDGLWPVTNSPYFKSPVEYLLSVVMSALKADEWNRSWLTEGNHPNMLIGAPETWTPEQIERYQAYFDSILAGNTQERQKARIVPSGTSKLLDQSRKDADFQEFERWLMARTCSMMGVHPASIGYASEQYKYSQEAMMDATSMFGVGSILALRKELFDDLLEMLGFADLEMANRPNMEERADAKAERLTKECGGPYKTINEARSEIGLLPMEDGDELREAPGGASPSSDPFEFEDDQDDSRRLEDLRKWQAKAIARLKGDRPAQCEFQSLFIEESENAAIFESLGRCATTDEVVAVFRGYEDQLRGPDGRWIPMGPVVQFIEDSAKHKNTTKYLQVTTIGRLAAKRIEAQSGVNLLGWKVSLSADDIRHSLKRHGPNSIMAKNGQVPISQSTFIDAIRAINHPDDSRMEPGEKEGAPNLLHIHKKLSAKELVSVSVTSIGRRSVAIKTIYMR